MKKRILSVLITVVMLIGMLPVTVFAVGATNEIRRAVVQKDSDVILYPGNSAHVMQTGATVAIVLSIVSILCAGFAFVCYYFDPFKKLANKESYK